MDMYITTDGSVQCESCKNGEHLSYGDDHRDGPEGRNDCKNVGVLNGKVVQCNCVAG